MWQTHIVLHSSIMSSHTVYLFFFLYVMCLCCCCRPVLHAQVPWGPVRRADPLPRACRLLLAHTAAWDSRTGQRPPTPHPDSPDGWSRLSILYQGGWGDRGWRTGAQTAEEGVCCPRHTRPSQVRPGPMFTKKLKIRIRIKLINSYNLVKNSLNLLKFSLFIKELRTDILVSPKYSYRK